MEGGKTRRGTRLARDTVEWDFGGGRLRKIRFLKPEVPVFNTTDTIRTHVAAMGPRTRERAAGRDAARHRKPAFTFGIVLRDGESCATPRVRAQAGPLAAMVLHNLMAADAGDVEEDALLPADFIRKSTFTGTVPELAGQVKRSADAGYSEVSFVVLSQFPEAVDDWARVVEAARL